MPIQLSASHSGFINDRNTIASKSEIKENFVQGAVSTLKSDSAVEYPQLDADIKPKLEDDVAQNSNALDTTDYKSAGNASETDKSNFTSKSPMLCEKKCKSNDDLMTREKKEIEKFECSICKAVLASKRNFLRHMVIHSDDKPYSCEICMKSFKLAQCVKIHMAVHTTDRTFKCEMCGNTFKTKVALKTHTLAQHEENSKHVCEICNKRFAYAAVLRYHLKTNHKDVYTCEVCNANCTSHHLYKKHQLTHQGITKSKKYACKLCPKAYEYEYRLIEHTKKVHEGARKQFICDICGKTTTRKVVLDVHKRRHEGIKPFQCNNCGKMFYNSQELQTHTLTHTGDKPFSCEICKKKFTQKGTLNIHMRSHTGERPYKCDLCEKAFVSRTQLNWHKKTKHQIA